MDNSNPMIRCKKCGATFEPDVMCHKVWMCPSCHAKNPNLKRHYRSVADVCILGFVATVVFLIFSVKERGIDVGIVLSSAHAVLLLVTIIWVYKSNASWKDAVAKTLIWTVFVLTLSFNAVIFLLFAGWLSIPILLVYAIVFSYLFWLQRQANKCTVF